MVWKCLIVDDEPLAIEVLKSHIESVSYLQLEGTSLNAFEAIEFLQSHQVDLLFVDIQMPKLLGTTFIRTLQNRPKVIFTTAYKEFALDAFDLDAVDYLLKPISMERFLKSVNKLIRVEQPKQDAEKILPETRSGFVYFRTGRKMVKLFYDEILYIESVKDYIKVLRKENPPLLVKQSITATEGILPASLFVRVHRSFIVAKDKITAMTHHDIEIGNIEIPIGRLYRQEVAKIKSPPANL
jgi:DNA-binding LytR/AlgR family response regulator